MKKIMKKTVLIFGLLFLISPLFAAYNRLGIHDSSEIREKLLETWLTAPLETVRQNPPEIRYNDNGQPFQVRLEESDTTFQIFVSPEAKINVSVYSDLGVQVEERIVYPGDSAGSWVLIKDKKTGNPIRIRYYFLKDSDVYIQFTPSPRGKSALVDLVIFGNYAARGVPTGVPFNKFYTASFEDVIIFTENKIPWKYVLYDTDMYHSVKQMCAVIRERIPHINMVPDAMYDENKDLVHISTGEKFENIEENDEKLSLSSAGFVKWISDGLIEPLTGGLLKREPLIQETIKVKDNGHQGVLSQRYDLFFSLNWIRNLASAIISVYSGSTYLFNQSGVDVTINPFASTYTEKGVANIVTYIENTGYTVSVLKSLFYVLAATEPGTFYFGAIRGTDRTVSPEIKAFNECVAFFPYFQDDGGFECAVFMNGREMTLEDFCLLFSEDFVSLTRVKASEQFFPY